MTVMTRMTFLFAWVVALAAALAVYADDKSKMAEGTVVSAGSEKLTIKDKDSKEHTYTVDTSAKVMVDGKMGKLEDLKKNMEVSVTLDGDKVISVTSSNPLKGAMAWH